MKGETTMDDFENTRRIITYDSYGAYGDEDGDGSYSYDRYNYSSTCTTWRIDYRAVLSPLMKAIGEYDALRLTLENQGGSMQIMQDIIKTLAAEFTIKSSYRDHRISLTDQEGLHACLRDVGNWRVYLDIRLTPHDMPVYYLCRVHEDYWAEYSLIVEDLYVSPGYPMIDERFIRLMSAGHEQYFLRLSQFRDSVRKMLSVKREALDYEVDDLILEVGRHVFQAAWHDDQRPGTLTAKHLDLPNFHRAIELLYLCLSGDLCELRSIVHPPIVKFFDKIYPQPAIAEFLMKLRHMDGSVLNDLPKKTLNLYIRLSNSFSQFMKSEVTWGSYSSPIPLYKIVFGNFSRLDFVGESLKKDPTVQKTAEPLEKTSKAVIDEILNME
jgi:hypothetical protein